jgi:methionine--tRNA ligase beta chain
MTPPRPNAPASARLPPGIWALGFVSMLMDISSEMIHALLPLYMVGALGASTLAVGLIEGIAEATASITKVFSGALSDKLGKRKLLAAIGYGLAACSKPVFPLAGSLGWVVAARFVDRIGKGTYDDFAKLDLRVGLVIAAEAVPKAKKLLRLTVDLGEPEPRTIVAGIAAAVAADAMVGRRVIVVANLAPAVIRGVTSQGMILAAGDDAIVGLGAVTALGDAAVPPGARIK